MTLSDLLRLEQQATKGPWTAHKILEPMQQRWRIAETLHYKIVTPQPFGNGYEQEHDNLELITASRNVLRELVGVAKAAQEVWDSVPATYHADDPMVRRHAQALNAQHDALASLAARLETLT